MFRRAVQPIQGSFVQRGVAHHRHRRHRLDFQPVAAIERETIDALRGCGRGAAQRRRRRMVVVEKAARRTRDGRGLHRQGERAVRRFSQMLVFRRGERDDGVRIGSIVVVSVDVHVPWMVREGGFHRSSGLALILEMADEGQGEQETRGEHRAGKKAEYNRPIER